MDKNKSKKVVAITLTPDDHLENTPAFLRQQGQELAKGSLQARTPFDPKQVPSGDHKAVNDWQFGKGPRESIPRMDGGLRLRMLQRLHAGTVSRRSATGEPEFLLHRGMHYDEFKDTVSPDGKLASPGHGPLSWTMDPMVAHGHAHDAIVDAEGQQAANETHPSELPIISAWIPESQIHAMPLMLGAPHGGPNEFGPGGRKDLNEAEVIVNHDGRNHSIEPMVYHGPSNTWKRAATLTARDKPGVED